MFVAELTFECFDNTTVTQVERAVNDVLEALRYNGQILGREFPIVMGDGCFTVRVLCPEQESFSRQFNSAFVEEKLLALSDAALLSPKVKWLGQISTPMPVQKTFTRAGKSSIPPISTPVHRCEVEIRLDRSRFIVCQPHEQKIIKMWCNGRFIGKPAMKYKCLHDLLTQKPPRCQKLMIRSALCLSQGMKLRERIEAQSQIPTYYYQYRVGGTDLKSEQDRCCPSCGKQWRLDSPLHEVIYFKCDNCRLVSNLSWNYQ